MADTGDLGAWDIEDADEDAFDCPAGPDGCPLAGTEECDWECPYGDEDDD